MLVGVSIAAATCRPPDISRSGRGWSKQKKSAASSARPIRIAWSMTHRVRPSNNRQKSAPTARRTSRIRLTSDSSSKRASNLYPRKPARCASFASSTISAAEFRSAPLLQTGMRLRKPLTCRCTGWPAALAVRSHKATSMQARRSEGTPPSTSLNARHIRSRSMGFALMRMEAAAATSASATVAATSVQRPSRPVSVRMRNRPAGRWTAIWDIIMGYSMMR